MAQQNQQKLCCSICLDLLKDPVTIPCGHTYCMGCIQSYWGEKGQTETHNCPQCRQVFTPRPALVKNNMLSDLVEELKKTEAASADECSARPGDVVCDFCNGIKVKAQKSCLQCLVSYCEEHLQPHYKSPAFEKHKLVDPARGFQNICSHHNEVMKIFCRTDQKCICILCSVDEHKGHNMVSAATEVAQKQKELGPSRQRIQQRIRIREKDLNALQQEVEAVNNCADNAVRDSERIVAEVKQQIRSRQIAEVSRAKELQEKLEQEIAELRRKDTELQQLSGAEDHTEFLHKYHSSTQLTEPTDSPDISIQALRYSEDVTAAVSGARDKLQDVLTEEWSKISLTDSGSDVLLSQPEPKTREDFQKDTQEFTLDPNTAHLHLYVDRTYVKHSGYLCKKFDHPDRFTSWPQVLCSETLTGRCYWEVEWHGNVFVAVAYKKISRTGNKSTFGNNDMSWALQCSENQFTNYYEFRHKKIRTSILGPHSSRLGVYLDHSSGLLSFYSISDTMTLLHTVQTRFTQPLCPGFGVYCSNSNAKFGNADEEETRHGTS